MPKRRDPPRNTYWRGDVLWGSIKVRGQKIRWSLRTRDEATAVRRVEERRQREVARAHFGDNRVTYDEAFAAWSEHIVTQVSASTYKRYAVSLGQLAPILRPLFLDEIDTTVVSDVVKHRRLASASTATIRRDLTALSSVLTFAEDEGWRDDNPALARLRRLRERHEPIVLPQPEHIELVVRRAPGLFAAMIQAACLTGCRQAELGTAERRRLDHERRQLTVIGKGNKLRVIELSDAAYDLLSKLPAALGSKWLFWHDDGEPYRGISSRFKTIVKSVEAGAQKGTHEFRPFRFHDLRNFYAVTYLKDGGSIYDLQRQLGHSSVKTTERYLTYLTADEERAAKSAGTRSGPQLKRFAV